MTDKIAELVNNECAGSYFGPAFFDEHLAVVADCAARLAAPLGADVEIVTLAAWLHDLAAVRDPANQPAHARLGAELVPKVLAPYQYERALVDQVSRAVASHTLPLAPGSASPEEVCLSQADAVAQMTRPFYWFYFATSVRGLDYAHAKIWLANLLTTKWEGLAPPARRLVGDRCKAAMELLD